MNTLYWFISIASLVGVVLNIRGRRACFGIWLCTNATWAVADWVHELPAQAALQAVYAALSVYGLIRWKARPPLAPEGR